MEEINLGLIFIEVSQWCLERLLKISKQINTRKSSEKQWGLDT